MVVPWGDLGLLGWAIGTIFEYDKVQVLMRLFWDQLLKRQVCKKRMLALIFFPSFPSSSHQAFDSGMESSQFTNAMHQRISCFQDFRFFGRDESCIRTFSVGNRDSFIDEVCFFFFFSPFLHGEIVALSDGRVDCGLHLHGQSERFSSHHITESSHYTNIPQVSTVKMETGDFLSLQTCLVDR